MLIQPPRFVDQHVNSLGRLDEPGNRPRVAAIRESYAVELDHASHRSPFDRLMID